MPKRIPSMVGLFVLTVIQVYARDIPYAAPLEVGQRIEITLAKPYRTAGGVRVSATWTELSGRPVMTLAERGREETMRLAVERSHVRGTLTAVDDAWLTLDLGDPQPLLRIPRAAVVRWETLALAAQGAVRWPAGERVRIVSTELGRRELTGQLLAMDAETLLVKVASHPEPLRLRRSSVERFAVRRGTRGHAGTGAAIGFLGLTFPCVLLAAVTGDAEGSALAAHPAQVVGVCVAYGAGVGALLGSAVRTERWERVALSVSVLPKRHGGGVALSLRF